MSDQKDSGEKKDEDLKGTKTQNVTLRLDLKRLLDWGMLLRFNSFIHLVFL